MGLNATGISPCYTLHTPHTRRIAEDDDGNVAIKLANEQDQSGANYVMCTTLM